MQINCRLTICCGVICRDSERVIVVQCCYDWWRCKGSRWERAAGDSHFHRSRASLLRRGCLAGFARRARFCVVCGRAAWRTSNRWRESRFAPHTAQNMRQAIVRISISCQAHQGGEGLICTPHLVVPTPITNGIDGLVSLPGFHQWSSMASASDAFEASSKKVSKTCAVCCVDLVTHEADRCR